MFSSSASLTGARRARVAIGDERLLKPESSYEQIINNTDQKY